MGSGYRCPGGSGDGGGFAAAGAGAQGVQVFSLRIGLFGGRVRTMANSTSSDESRASAGHDVLLGTVTSPWLDLYHLCKPFVSAQTFCSYPRFLH